MRRPGDLVDLAGHWTLDRIARNSWSTPRGSGDGRESSRTACRTRSPLDPSASRPGELVHTRAIGTQPELPGTAVQHREHGRGHDSPRTAGRHRRHSDPSTRRSGELVDPAGPLTRARVAWKSWSTPRALGPEPKSPRTAGPARATSGTGPSYPGQLVDAVDFGHACETRRCVGRPRGPSDPGPRRPGQLVDTTGPWTLARIARES